MGNSQLQSVVEHIRNLAAPELANDRTDQELLRDFSARRDQAAFTTLVKRHASMVFGICRRVLNHAQDAEDAFQATFLLLAHKATAIRKQTALASWLHGVAFRTAMRSKRDSARRRFHEKRVAPMARTPAASELALRELQALLDEEIERLPEKYKAPFVLCCLEGKSKAEAATELGWRVGTVSSRLAYARKFLQTRLSRRGVSLAGVLGAAALAPDSAIAGVPHLLIDGTVRAALQFTASKGLAGGLISAEVAALVKMVSKSMLISQLKPLLALLLAVSATAAGVGVFAHQAVANPRRSEAANAASRWETALNEQPRPKPLSSEAGGAAQGTAVVRGKVVDPDGKALSGARVGVLTQHPVDAGEARTGGPWLRLDTTDGKGNFRLIVQRPMPKSWSPPVVVAESPGYGVAWQPLDPGTNETDAVLRLPPERLLRGHVLDAQGKPASGALVQVAYVSAPGGGSSLWPCASPGPTWPASVITDAQGRFVLRGLGNGVQVSLDIRHDQSAPQSVLVKSNAQDAEEVRVSLSPARVLSTRVAYGDTGKPVPHARLSISWSSGSLTTEFRTGADGRLELRPYPGQSFYVYAFAPPGEPYLGRSQEFSWPEGVVRDTLDIALPRGTLVRGKVTDAESGAPVAGALVGCWPHHTGNPHWQRDMLAERYSTVRSNPDGTFQLGVVPGPGFLRAQGPTDDYIHRELFWDRRRWTYSEKPNGWRVYPDGWVKLDVQPDAVAEGVQITLRRGVTLEGRLVGPQDQPIEKAKMVSRLNVIPASHAWGGPVQVRGGRFCLHGCDPSASYPVFFLDTDHEWGAAVTLSGKQAGGVPVTVRLVPCGSAKARLVNTRGQPLGNFPPDQPLLVQLIVTPGYSFPGASGPAADAASLRALDRKRYENLRSDRDGRCTLPALIPGATYRIGSGHWPVGLSPYWPLSWRRGPSPPISARSSAPSRRSLPTRPSQDTVCWSSVRMPRLGPGSFLTATPFTSTAMAMET
jgi:RNA polymerase sigma factor (sigma-70 family)